MQRQKEIIILVVSLFILTIAWIAFDLYHNAVTSTISAPLQQDILPIAPDFDTQVVESLKQRKYSNPTYTFSSQQQTIATPSGSIQKTTSPKLFNAIIASPSVIPTTPVIVTP